MKQNDTLFIGMSSGFGPLAQIMPILKHLQESNIEIVCTILRYAGEMIKELGFTHLELTPMDRIPQSVPKNRRWWNQDYFWAKYGYMDYHYVRQLIDNYTIAIEKLKPKAIIAALDPPTTVVAWRLGIPLITITQACEHPYGKGGRTTWWEELPENIENTCPIMNRVLEDIGVKPIQKMEYLNIGDLTIIPSIPEFDVINDPNVIYTGPMFWQGPEAQTFESTSVFKQTETPKIFVYTGHLTNSWGGPAGMVILQNVVDAFANTEFEVCIAIGTGQEVPNSIKSTENITIRDWVPVNQLIPKCNLVIHHGGHGSCLQGIGHGIQSIVIPTTDEREYNARQMAEMNISQYIHPDNLTPEVLLNSARQALKNTAQQEEAKRLSKKIKDKKYDRGEKAALSIIELMQR